MKKKEGPTLRVNNICREVELKVMFEIENPNSHSDNSIA